MSDVYEPAEDSLLLKKHVGVLAWGRTLEMGTGSGVLAVEAAKKAKSVLAADINPAAIAAAKWAAQEANVSNISFVQSDLFSNIGGLFDCIIFNPPYLPADKRSPDIALDGGKKGYETILAFLNQARSHLAPKGTILLLFSSHSKPTVILQELDDLLLSYQFIDQQRIFFEELFVVAITKSPLLVALEKEKLRSVRRFAHGKRGVIYTAMKGKTKVAIKAALTARFSENIIKEAKILKAVNKFGIGPKLLSAKDDRFTYRFVDGPFIGDYLAAASEKYCRALLLAVLRQCRRLDSYGLSKMEMTRPIKHVIVEKGKPVMIDFERARSSGKARNVTQFCQYLAGIKDVLSGKGIVIDVVKLRQLAGAYKRSGSVDAYVGIESMISPRHQVRM